MMPRYLPQPKRSKRVTYTAEADENGVVLVEGSDGSRVYMSASLYRELREWHSNEAAQ